MNLITIALLVAGGILIGSVGFAWLALEITDYIMRRINKQ